MAGLFQVAAERSSAALHTSASACTKPTLNSGRPQETHELRSVAPGTMWAAYLARTTLRTSVCPESWSWIK